MYDSNQCETDDGTQQRDTLIFETHRQKDDDNDIDDESEGSELNIMIVNELAEIKALLLLQRDEQAKTLNAIEELKDEVKARDHKILELQNDLLQMKLESMKKEQNDLKEKMKNITVGNK